MNQPDDELAARIARQLDYGVENLDSGTRERLAGARRRALSHYREQPARVFGLAWAGRGISGGLPGAHGARYLAGAALVLVLLGYAYWQSTGTVNDFSEIDVSLLTDDLPINAYLDKGFDSWLKRAPR